MSTFIAEDKLGPLVGGMEHTLDTTVRVIQIVPGVYSLEPDVECYVLLGNATGVGTASDAIGTGSTPVAAIDTVAKMRLLGVKVPAGAEVRFRVDGVDKFLAFCKTASASAGLLRINDRDNGRRA